MSCTYQFLKLLDRFTTFDFNRLGWYGLGLVEGPCEYYNALSVLTGWGGMDWDQWRAF